MSVTAYHFVGGTLRDGRPIPADGEWLVHDGPVVICESGLHASRRPWHALKYVPGNTLCLVECEDVRDEQDDKLVCARRRIVKRIDAEPLLRAFARDEARRVLHLWNAPDVVRKYLAAGDEAMRGAAWSAARDAARGAAWSAAKDAARDAAWSAAWYAARGAPWSAALGAAWAAAWYAARDAAWYAARDAAWDAARDAAWDAARDASGQRFDDMIVAAFTTTEAA